MSDVAGAQEPDVTGDDGITDDERWRKEHGERVAIHEGAHAIMHLATGQPMRSASIIPDSGTAGRVTPRRQFLPEMRESLILGPSPETMTFVHHQIMVFLAGEAAVQIARGWGTDVPVPYPGNSTDYERALDLAITFSGSGEAGFALLAWLRRRTLDVVAGFWFQRLLKRLVPELLSHDELSEVEIQEILRPIAAEVLDISPKTWRGRLRLRWARIRSRVRRALRRISRR